MAPGAAGGESMGVPDRPPIERRFPAPSVMGVINVTPDSFSDGGVHLRVEPAVTAAWGMLDAGAAIIDVGGESTRPGSAGVSAAEELRRVEPVVADLTGAPVSIDTSKAPVARRALELGAELVNDVTALRGDPELAGVVADAGCYLCLMHMRGEPRTMQVAPAYDDVVSEVKRFLEERLDVRGRGGSPRGARLPRSGDRLREDRRAQLRARPPPVGARRARPSDPRRVLAQELARRSHGRTRPERSRRRSGLRSSAYERGATIIRAHDVRDHVEALAAAQRGGGA